MAVIQTPHGKVIGLIPEKEQPAAQPVREEKKTAVEKTAVAKTAPARKPGRPAKK